MGKKIVHGEGSPSLVTDYGYLTVLRYESGEDPDSAKQVLIREVPTDTVYVDRPVEIIKEVRVEVPVEVEVIKEVFLPADHSECGKEVLVEKLVYVDRPVEVEKIVYQDKIVEKEITVEKLVEVEKIVELPVERLVEVVKNIPIVPNWAKVCLGIQTLVILALIYLK